MGTEYQYGIVFVSGGGILGAHAGGLQYEDALHNHRCPAVYLTTSAGFPVAVARAVAEYRIAQTEETEGHTLSPAARATVIRATHLHLWNSVIKIGQQYGHLASAQQLMNIMLGAAVPAAQPFAARVAAINGAIMDDIRRISPWLTMPFDIVQKQANALHPLALFLRTTFPDVDKTLQHPRAPRIIANVRDEFTGQMAQRDTYKGHTLEQMVGTMSVNGVFPWAEGRYTDGGHTGYNGDYFHVLKDLIVENPAYAAMPVTFVNLGHPDLPHDAKNRRVAEQMQKIGRQKNLFREFRLDRSLPWLRDINKLQSNPDLIVELFSLGQKDYLQYMTKTRAPHRADALLAAISHLHNKVPAAA